MLLEGLAVARLIGELATDASDVSDAEIAAWLMHLQPFVPVMRSKAVVETARRIVAREPGLGDAVEWSKLGLPLGIAGILWGA